jgi:hypothetical protein
VIFFRGLSSSSMPAMRFLLSASPKRPGGP